MFDLNGFKAINDALGHQAGDRALHEVAAVLRSMVRSYDLCVRYGGDEFVAILWECDAENAAQRCLEMERAVAATYFEGRPGETFPLSTSAGIAVYPEDGQTHEELIAVADRRMYQRKAGRREPLAQLPVVPSTT
jgi:diguanylate cyclase (GGDEF)-like protein